MHIFQEVICSGPEMGTAGMCSFLRQQCPKTDIGRGRGGRSGGSSRGCLSVIGGVYNHTLYELTVSQDFRRIRCSGLE